MVEQVENEEMVLTGSRLVRFSNDTNKAVIQQLTAPELKLYYGLLYFLFERGLAKVDVGFDEIVEIAGIESYKPHEIEPWLDKFWSKAKVTTIKETTYKDNGKKKDHTEFPFYSFFKVDYENRKLTLAVNPLAYNYVNGLTENYTTAKLNNIIATGSTYSARLHSLLSQYKFTGWYTVDVDELKFLMDCPKSYTTPKFNKRCLEPAVEEQKQFFPNLQVIAKVKGRKIVKYQFTFDKIEKKTPEELALDKKSKGKKKQEFTEDEVERILKENS